MARLRQRELAAFSQALMALYATDDYESLSGRILACVRGLFDCEFASFSWMDLRGGRLQTTTFSPVLVPDWPGMEAHQRNLPSDPAAAYIMRTASPAALKISDFVSLREYRNLPVYTEVFSRVRCDRRLGFAVQKDSPSAMIATVNRAGLNFTEEERTLLDLLRPHLLQAHSKAQAHRELRVEHQQERDDVGEAFGVGLGEIDATGKLRWITARGKSLLADFFPASGRSCSPSSLPAEMLRQLLPAIGQRGADRIANPLERRRFVWRFDGPAARRLNVRLIVGAVEGLWQIHLFEADAPLAVRELMRAFKLTARESEVLHWLTQGKTNGELGTILGITEKTVGKHLEHIFSKLHVENRTAAVRMAMERQR